MSRRRISARKSLIHGRGVFALRRIPANTRLIEYTGMRRKWADCRDEDDAVTYLFDAGRGLVIDPARLGNSARYINHSCNPNCEAVLEEGRIYIETLRVIRPGKELTYDYSLTLGRRPTKEDKKKLACNCGSRQCRGTLLDLKS